MKENEIKNIPLSLIDPFPEHPFKVLMDDEMVRLSESIKERGLITPITVRLKEDGRYETVSGHRRIEAAKLAGLKELPAEIKALSKDEAIIYMVDSNLQRPVILPSEKAKSYKMKLEAIKRLPGRPSKDNSGPMVQDFSRDEIGMNVGESGRQISRYIRLTELIPEILDMVDENRIAFRPAVELSYLTKENQKELLAIMEETLATPSLSQAIRLKELEKAGELDYDSLNEVMLEEKPNQKDRISFKTEDLKPYLPRDLPASKSQEYIIKALDFYKRAQIRAKSHER